MQSKPCPCTMIVSSCTCSFGLSFIRPQSYPKLINSLEQASEPNTDVKNENPPVKKEPADGNAETSKEFVRDRVKARKFERLIDDLPGVVREAWDVAIE